jgi:flagellar biosynthetic protein FliR
MITVTSNELYTWVATFLWPLARILALISTAPLLNNTSVPARVKIGLGAILTVIIAPTVPAGPAIDPMSLTGLLILAQQILIGLAMGFTVRIMFSCIELAGEVSGMTAGLSFASFYDPQSHGHTSVINQFMSLLMTMIYITTNMHLVLISTLAHTFTTLPISATPMSAEGFHQLALWGGRIFSAGVQIALPVIAALLITNIALGVLTRAAPALNLFGIGFPITIGMGLIMIALSLSYLATPMERLIQEGIDAIQMIDTAMVPKPR